jgi:hypothetical protein
MPSACHARARPTAARFSRQRQKVSRRSHLSASRLFYEYLPFAETPQKFLLSNRNVLSWDSLSPMESTRIVSHFNKICPHCESMGLITTVLPQPDSRGLDPAIHRCSKRL